MSIVFTTIALGVYESAVSRILSMIAAKRQKTVFECSAADGFKKGLER